MSLTPPDPIDRRPPGGQAGPRVSKWIVVVAAAGLFAAALGVTAWLVAVKTEAPPKPICGPGEFCSIPPTPPEPPACPHDDCAARAEATTSPPHAVTPATRADSPSEPRTGAGVWQSSELGYSFEFYDWITPTQQDGRSVTYEIASQNERLHAELHVEAVPADEATPEALLSTRRKKMAETMVSLDPDKSADTILDGPSVGFVSGVGGSYRGTLLSPTLEPIGPAVVAILAATDGRITVVFSYRVTGFKNAADVLHVRGWADGVLSSFEWSS